MFVHTACDARIESRTPTSSRGRMSVLIAVGSFFAVALAADCASPLNSAGGKTYGAQVNCTTTGLYPVVCEHKDPVKKECELTVQRCQPEVSGDWLDQRCRGALGNVACNDPTKCISSNDDDAPSDCKKTYVP